MPSTIELHIRRLPDASLVAELRAELPRSRADLGGAPIDLNPEVLRALSTSPDVYGTALTAMTIPTVLHALVAVAGPPGIDDQHWCCQ
jgi:hypothetical protein